MLSVLLYSILFVQIVYSVQLNCTDSKLLRVRVTCMLYVLLYSILSIQIVYSVQLNILTVIIERQIDFYLECATVQHIECTDSVQCATELY